MIFRLDSRPAGSGNNNSGGATDVGAAAAMLKSNVAAMPTAKDAEEYYCLRQPDPDENETGSSLRSSPDVVAAAHKGKIITVRYLQYVSRNDNESAFSFQVLIVTISEAAFYMPRIIVPSSTRLSSPPQPQRNPICCPRRPRRGTAAPPSTATTAAAATAAPRPAAAAWATDRRLTCPGMSPTRSRETTAG